MSDNAVSPVFHGDGGGIGGPVAIIDQARQRHRARRARLAALIAVSVMSLVAVLLIGGVGLPGAGDGREGGASESGGSGIDLLTVQQIRAEYEEGTRSKGRWLVSFRPDHRAIGMICDVPETSARRYAAALREPFPRTLLSFLEAKCA